MAEHHFYPRSPCGERQVVFGIACTAQGFLSTLSLRRATGATVLLLYFTRYFYPRSPCGERLAIVGLTLHDMAISIHALLAESDTAQIILGIWKHYFYPRSPCGERLGVGVAAAERFTFLSTLSLRRATSPVSVMARGIFISIHALLAESDASRAVTTSAARYFYPRSPCGERLWYHPLSAMQILISIHALLAESDYMDSVPPASRKIISIHALLAESDIASIVLCYGER